MHSANFIAVILWIIFRVLPLKIKRWRYLNTWETGVKDKWYLLKSMFTLDKYRVQINVMKLFKGKLKLNLSSGTTALVSYKITPFNFKSGEIK